MNNPWIKRALLWMLFAFILTSIFKQIVPNTEPGANQIAYSEFLEQVQSRNVKAVQLREIRGGTEIRALTIDNKVLLATATNLDRGLISDLINNDVKFDVKVPEESSMLFTILVSWGPMLLLIGVWIFFMKKMQGGGGIGGIGNFGKSKATHDRMPPKETFADVAGCDEAKQEVSEIVDFLKNPSKFQKLGGRIPRGILLVGNPGTGKTLLAKAMAGEAKVPFFSTDGSGFVEMFVGVGASRVRDLFENAKNNAPCIIFIDEIDAVGKKRGNGTGGGGNDEREQTLNAILVEMDGFKTSTTPVIVIAATNRADVLDPALVRPGRFDRQVYVPLPDIRGREQVLLVHMRHIPTSSNVSANVIARGTPGMSGADLANLVNEAALCAARRNGQFVEMRDFESAKDKIIMGAERKLIMTIEERRNTAYHESGHALIGKLLPKCDPVHKVTIIPRGGALGVTMSLPEFDTFTHGKEYLLSQIAMLFGGRIAEELFMNQMTTGASNDFERATQIARNMVTKWGMSDTLGRMVHAEHEGAFGGIKNVSEDTMRLVDAEINRILDEQYKKAKELIENNRDKIEALTKALLDWETIDAEQINDIMAGLLPRPPESADQAVDVVVKNEPPPTHVSGIDPESAKFAEQIGLKPLTPKEDKKQEKD